MGEFFSSMRSQWLALAFLVTGTIGSGLADAAGFVPSEKIFPATTRAWLSIPQPKEFRERFDRSQYGQLVADPAMEAFVESCKKQIESNSKQRLAKLGLTLDDLSSIVGGEIAVAAIEPQPDRLVTVMVVDTTGHEAAARQIVTQIGDRLVERKAKKIVVPDAPGELTVYELPPEKDERRATAPRDRRVAFALAKSALVVGDDAIQVGQAFAVLEAGRADSLETTESFKVVMDRCGKVVPATAAPLRWFVEPLPFARLWQAANPPIEKRKGPDYVAIFGRQGFDAIKGAGGLVTFSEGPHALRHHTLVHAPPLEGREPDAVDRFDLAARMLRFPNSKNMTPPAWVPRDADGWMALEWDLQTAFASAETLVDDIVGDKGVFQDVIASLKEDPDGPQIDVEADLVACLGKRVSLITDHVEPLGTDSERIVIAVSCADEARVAATIAKVMNADGDMEKITIGDHTAWQLVDRSHAIPTLEIETPGGSVTHADDESASSRREKLRDKEEKLLPHATVTVAHGHLLIASHRDMLEKVLTAPGGEDAITAAPDFKAMMAELAKYAPADVASRSFGREDESIRPAYELLRSGAMPKSQSVFGQILNGIMGDGKPGSVREQKIDGSALPEFEVIRKYLGTVGVALETLPEGWYVSGVVLPKPGEPEPGVARNPASPVGR